MGFLVNMSINPIKLYTSNGSRLLPGTQIIKGTKLTKIKTDFGKGLTTIKTTFAPTGQPTKLIITKKTDGKLEKTIFEFEGDYSLRRKTKIKKFLNNKHISTTIKSEVLSKPKNKNQTFLTRTVFTTTPLGKGERKETQIIEELSTNKQRKYIKTTATRNKQGELSNKTLEGNIKKLKQLENSHYLFFRSYSMKDFVTSIIPYAKKLQKVSKRDIEYFFEKLNEKVAGNSSSVDGFGTVKIDIDKIITKSNAVNIINHEYRHQYQDSIIEKFEIKGLKGILRNIFSPLKYYYARKFANARKNYVSIRVDENKYNKNYLEIDARLAGEKAKKEYLLETGFLDEIFPHSKELFTGNEEFFRMIWKANITKNINVKNIKIT